MAKLYDINTWISVVDALPPVGMSVLVYCPFDDKYYVAYRINTYTGTRMWRLPTVNGGKQVITRRVTHWTEIPYITYESGR